MLKQNTTFIIGAGSSSDFGFPLGDKLREHIIGLLAIKNPNASINFDDQELTQLLHKRAIQIAGASDWTNGMEVYRRAAGIIRAGLPFARSIDSFLDGLRDEPEVEFLGKLAIAIIILRAESVAPLMLQNVSTSDNGNNHEQKLAKLVTSWQAQLGQILFEGHTRDTVDNVFEHASFVIFNYDRCIEEFLTASMTRRFAIERSRALDAVAKCSFVHPYGQVGAYLPGQEGHVPFGECDGPHLLAVASGIKTFTEAMEQQVGAKVKDSVARAKTIVFMGFGWLPQNMELLQATDRMTEAQKVFATTMGIGPGEIPVINDQIDRMLGRGRHSANYPISIEQSAEFIQDFGDCRSLMNNCWLRLTSTQ